MFKGVWVISLQEAALPCHFLTLGFVLRGTALDFLTSTWTRERPTVLSEKLKYSASGSKHFLGINCVPGLEL